MKVAVASQGPHLDSPVDDRFGRSPYFILADPSSKDHCVLPNPNVAAAQGAGTRTAQLLGEQGVDAVLVGHIGPNPLAAFATAGITVYTGIRGTVDDALEDFLSGRLTEVSEPTVPSHAGLGHGPGKGAGGAGNGIGGR